MAMGPLMVLDASNIFFSCEADLQAVSRQLQLLQLVLSPAVVTFVLYLLCSLGVTNLTAQSHVPVECCCIFA